MFSLRNCHLIFLFIVFNWVSSVHTKQCKVNMKYGGSVRDTRRVDYDDYYDQGGGTNFENYDDDNDDHFHGRSWQGLLINVSEAPFSASVFKGHPSGVYKCSGSFITPKVVITMAHCFSHPLEKHSYYVRYSSEEPALRGPVIQAADIIVHESFSCDHAETKPSFDIALIILSIDTHEIGLDQVLSLPNKREGSRFISDKQPVMLNFIGTGPSHHSENRFLLKRHEVYLYKTGCTGWTDFNPRYQLCTRGDDNFIACEGARV